jgi:signal transduction histidine kinase
VLKGLKMAESLHAKNGVVIENGVPDHMPVILGDQDALAESFGHLITNALEATDGKPDGRIEIMAKELDTRDMKRGVIVTVHDNGAGIPAEARDKVFSPFYTTKARGMGLGLPIVKRTVVDHSGRVHIESGPQGTTVSILLPGGRGSEKKEVKHEAHISH